MDDYQTMIQCTGFLAWAIPACLFLCVAAVATINYRPTTPLKQHESRQPGKAIR